MKWYMGALAATLAIRALAGEVELPPGSELTKNSRGEAVVVLTGNNRAWSWNLDRLKLQRSNNTATVWVTQMLPKEVRHTNRLVFQQEIYCPGPTSRVLRVVSYRGEQVIREEDNQDTKFREPVPGTVQDEIVKSVCKVAVARGLSTQSAQDLYEAIMNYQPPQKAK